MGCLKDSRDIGISMRFKKFSEQEPICNSDILVSDGNNIWICQSYDGNFSGGHPTHYIQLIDLEPLIIKAKDQIEFHCKE